VAPFSARVATDTTRTVAFGNVGEVMVIAWANQPVDDATYLAYLKSHIAFLETSEPIGALLTVSPSFSPSLRQRGMMKDVEAGLRMEGIRSVAMVSDSTIARGAVQALGWMFPRKRAIRAFPLAELSAAATWLVAQGARSTTISILALAEQLRGMLVDRRA